MELTCYLAYYIIFLAQFSHTHYRPAIFKNSNCSTPRIWAFFGSGVRKKTHRVYQVHIIIYCSWQERRRS